MTDESTFALHTASDAAETVVLTVTGEVDMTTAPELAKAFEGMAGPVHRVIVDLSAVAFLDSSGLNVLLRGRRELAATDIDLRVVAPPASVVRRVIEIAQLHESLSPVDSLDDALV
jgi:anti-anti-sigma factor